MKQRNNQHCMQDLVMRNPPYQESDGGAQSSASPVYNKFIEEAKKLNPDYLEMIIPARWYAGGKGLDDFRTEMLGDYRLSKLHDFPKTADCFPGVNIRGGVCYFLWDKNKTKPEVNIISHQGNNSFESTRPLKYADLNIFIRDSQSLSILDKVSSKSKIRLSEIVSSRKPFGITGPMTKTNSFSEEQSASDDLTCYVRGKKKLYCQSDQVLTNKDWIQNYKVLIPRANNIGTELNDDNLNSFVAKPGEICSEAYIAIGSNQNLNEEEASNLSKYLRTKFVRFLHKIAKVSQDATSKTWKFVPLEDFGTNSDINWDRSISEIDSQLADKYGLTLEEKDFIDKNIKEME